MSKAKSVFVCVFTDKAPNSFGSYAPELLGAPEAAWHATVANAASELFQKEGIEGTVYSICHTGDEAFKDYLKGNATPRPFIAIMGEFADGDKRQFVTRNPTLVKNYIRAMWAGEFEGTGLPTNPGDGDGGWGQGDGGLLCKLLPPLCALGFLPWLALSAYSTYRAVESRSTVGKAMWGIPAALFWQGFFARGGVKQIQWWVKAADFSFKTT